MEVKIDNAEVLTHKTVFKSGVIFGFKKYAGRRVAVVVLTEKEDEQRKPDNKKILGDIFEDSNHL